MVEVLRTLEHKLENHFVAVQCHWYEKGDGNGDHWSSALEGLRLSQGDGSSLTHIAFPLFYAFVCHREERQRRSDPKLLYVYKYLLLHIITFICAILIGFSIL